MAFHELRVVHVILAGAIHAAKVDVILSTAKDLLFCKNAVAASPFRAWEARERDGDAATGILILIST